MAIEFVRKFERFLMTTYGAVFCLANTFTFPSSVVPSGVITSHKWRIFLNLSQLQSTLSETGSVATFHNRIFGLRLRNFLSLRKVSGLFLKSPFSGNSFDNL